MQFTLKSLALLESLKQKMKLEIQLLLIGLGGALGAMSRFGIATMTKSWFGEGFPIGTLIANLTGCFLIGMLVGSGQAEKSDPLRLGLGVGFLGALTTFSTFGAETIAQIDDGRWIQALGNVSANVVLGLACVMLGMMTSKKLF